MGIQGLLPFLKKIHSPVNISQYGGCTVAIDAYCWLHRGAFACAEKLALGEKTDQYVFYCMKYINYLLSQDIKPIMVLDGCSLPSKREVEKGRRERREVNRKKAAQFLREGRRAEARDCLQKCIDVTPQMALELIKACRAKNVDCLVAPYEADAQLAYLSKAGIAQVVITEDSDLLLFGCERILFKMDHLGNGVMIEKRRLNEVMALKNGFYTFDKFRYMCILSGCDYLPSLTGIGLVKANKVFKMTQQTDVKMVLKKLPTYIKLTDPVSQEYIDGFVRADNTFLYQLVFDPCTACLMPLHPYPPGVKPEDMPYAGTYKSQPVAYQIALGNIDIYTEQKMDDFDPKRDLTLVAAGVPLNRLSIWHPHYVPTNNLPLKEKQVKGHVSTKGRDVIMNTGSLMKSVLKKRRTSAEENDVGITDGQLSHIYTSNISPSKRPRLSPEPDSARILQNVTTTHPADTSNYGHREELHPGTVTKCDPVTMKDPVTTKEHNIFAVKSPEVKKKFDVNRVKVEVKSRFFASSHKDSYLLDSLAGLDRDVKSSREEDAGSRDDGACTTIDSSNTATKCVTTGVANKSDLSPASPGFNTKSPAYRETARIPDDSSQTDQVLLSPMNNVKAPVETLKSTPRSKSAFTWSKFSFLKKSDCSQNSKSSSNVCNLPFIKVSPNQNSNTPASIAGWTSFISDGDTHTPKVDGACIDKPVILDTESTLLPSARSSTDSPSVTDSSQEDDNIDDVTISLSCPVLPHSLTPKGRTLSQPTISTTSSREKISQGPACRASGLRTPPLKQASVRDILTKFASSSSLKKSRAKCLSEET